MGRAPRMPCLRRLPTPPSANGANGAATAPTHRHQTVGTVGRGAGHADGSFPSPLGGGEEEPDSQNRCTHPAVVPSEFAPTTDGDRGYTQRSWSAFRITGLPFLAGGVFPCRLLPVLPIRRPARRSSPCSTGPPSAARPAWPCCSSSG